MCGDVGGGRAEVSCLVNVKFEDEAVDALRHSDNAGFCFYYFDFELNRSPNSTCKQIHKKLGINSLVFNLDHY